MKFTISEVAESTRHDIITGSGKLIGAVYWFGGLRGHSERPYNVILMSKDQGMFENLREVRQFLEAELTQTPC